MKRRDKVLIVSGGTGGHIFPALAVARAMEEKNYDVQWLGSQGGMEERLVKQQGFRLHLIAVQGFRGKNALAKLTAVWQLMISIFKSYKLIKTINPDFVIGFGGYVSAPGGIAARLLFIPFVLHEQNAVAGTTNRLLAKFANLRLTAFPDVLSDAKTVGNPLRKEICAIYMERRDPENQQVLNILVLGGSLGARKINQVVPSVLCNINKTKAIQVWHQCGKGKATEVKTAYQKFGSQVRCDDFIENISEAYQWADIVICRAGALTVSEIAVAGLVAIFIPFPYAIDNHQVKNAAWLEDNQAAKMIEEKELTEQHLEFTVLDLIQNPEKRMYIKEQLRRLAVHDATDRIVSLCESYCQKGACYAS